LLVNLQQEHGKGKTTMADSSKTTSTTIELSSIPPIRWIEKLVDRPGFGTWIAFLALIAGCLASFFTDDIKASVPFRWPVRDFPWPGRLNEIALLFWVVVGVWFILFWVQQRVASKTIALLQKQAADIAGKVIEVSKDVSTIGSDTHAIGISTETIHKNVQAANQSAHDLRRASEEAQKKIDHVDQAVNKVQQSAATLREIVETLPLGPFIGQFGLLIGKMQDLLAKCITRVAIIPGADLSGPIRDLLSFAATLAEVYDGRAQVRYAANIMVYIKATADPPYLQSEVQTLLRFWPKEELGALEGVIVLLRDFSSVAHAFEEKQGVDPLVEELAFAIPKETKNTKTGKWRVLPGAPRVFVGGGDPSISERLKTHLVEDIGSFDFENELDIDADCARELQLYYQDGGPGSSAKSCLTFPLLDTKGQIRAVLNIHCSSSPWLGGRGPRQANFAMLALPLVSEIGNLLELLSD
jgi:hypothetical protein